MPEPTETKEKTSEELFEAEIEELERPTIHTWGAVLGALGLGIVLGCILVGFLVNQRVTDRRPKTASGLTEMTLAEPQNTVPKPPERFRWEPVSGAARYVVTVLEADSGRVIMVRPISAQELMPTTDEVALFRKGLYSWMVEAQSQDGTPIAAGEGAFSLTANQATTPSNE